MVAFDDVYKHTHIYNRVQLQCRSLPPHVITL